MKKIEIETWARRKHFEFFKAFDAPHFNVTANVDVTNLYTYAKESNQSFFKLFLYGAVRAANATPELRYRIRGEEVVEHEVVHPSFTVMLDEDVFNFCAATFYEDLPTFLQEVTTRMERAADKVVVGDDEPDDLLYITSVPWVTFTSIMHPTHQQQHDSVPRIAWGKFERQGERLVMPLSVQAHHALVDGVHIGKYYETLQAWLDQEFAQEGTDVTEENEFDRAVRLREEGQLEQAKQLFLSLLRKDEKNPRLHAYCAWCYDSLGEERQAVPHYERAIRLGLTGEELAESYLGLGSTYRALGRYAEAEQLFKEAIEQFPNHGALKVFQAMTHYNVGRHEEATGTLLELLASPKADESIARYRRAIAFYARNLNETYD
ncbi:tetratricopeptide repeat protein [Exiguobacterium profundum]|uniref:tetratricopeptide repeat protein n=1 Tax=Exiguobacterium TaxID=33986 RepID=UPI0018C3A28B|nr:MULTISPECIES: tetratricopeptide repeat protein [Exiguobacterium]MBG0918286.1 tetratricopeptide repeat protein [Exiguobacterium sp. SRB7LM]MCT4798504.1 tetratricopeptide repeat protein [Exiguobacterium profundum]MDT0192820.1 tetratricopeptide repeat protein [Exiguobacterium sp. BG5(2022)]QPI67889.1 tetratricopeptide repeat protein [Exiguobacterium sp. PBE]